ncbi:MAG: tyrosine-type recombinase/integrase, partial [Candidatus Kapaibacteriota bacterium]
MEAAQTHVGRTAWVLCFMRFSDAIQKFIEWRSFKSSGDTIRGYELTLRQFGVFVRNCDLEEVSLDDIIEYYKLQKLFKWDERTFVVRSSALRTFFNFYRQQGYQVIDPQLIPMPKVTPKVPRVATEEQYQKLLSIIPKNNKDPRHIRNLAIINLLWDTGARVGEVRALNISDLDFSRNRAVIHTEKSRGVRPLREIFWT